MPISKKTSITGPRVRALKSPCRYLITELWARLPNTGQKKRHQQKGLCALHPHLIVPQLCHSSFTKADVNAAILQSYYSPDSFYSSSSRFHSLLLCSASNARIRALLRDLRAGSRGAKVPAPKHSWSAVHRAAGTTAQLPSVFCHSKRKKIMITEIIYY